MTRRRSGLTSALAGVGSAALLLLAAAPAMAGDAVASASPAGSWRTATHGVKQTVTFSPDGKVFGDSGCNRFMGGYTVKGNRITIGPLASTMMACPQPQMDAERQFLTGLDRAKSFTRTAHHLTITTTGGTLQFTATPPQH
jgi:heat shock protein HslJ